MTTDRIFRLAAQPNNFDWGPLGKDSLVAKYVPTASKPGFPIEDEKPYSELWMGTHPTNPSYIYPDGPLLSEHLSQHSELLGDATKFPPPFTGKGEEQKDGGHVPFLFKILCARKALPLQIHPNKELASKLHKEDPDNFPDTNHKPEIAVCLSERFLGFANFRPLAEIQSLLSTILSASDLSSSLSRPSADRLKAIEVFAATALSSQDPGEANKGEVEAMKKAWTAMLSPDNVKSEEVKKAVSAFAAKVRKDGEKVFEDAKIEQRDKQNVAEAVIKGEEFYPGDISTLACVIFMNLVELHKGEGMYVGADGLHAWLTGNIVELMATSDNVLNIGFTDPSEIADSLSTVSQTVTATPIPASSIKLSTSTFAKSTRGNIVAYSVPFEEFSIMHVKASDTLKGLSGPAVGIVTQKGARVRDIKQGANQLDLEEGSVFFIGARTDTEFELKEGEECWLAFYDGDEETKGQVGKQ